MIRQVYSHYGKLIDSTEVTYGVSIEAQVLRLSRVSTRSVCLSFHILYASSGLYLECLVVSHDCVVTVYCES